MPSHMTDVNLIDSWEAIIVASGSAVPGVGHANSTHSELVSLKP